MERKPNQLELFDFEPIGLPAERIVTRLATRPARAESGKLNEHHVHKAQADKGEAEKNESRVGSHLPNPRLMQIALEAVMRPRRNAPKYRPRSKRGSGRDQDDDE